MKEFYCLIVDGEEPADNGADDQDADSIAMMIDEPVNDIATPGSKRSSRKYSLPRFVSNSN